MADTAAWSPPEADFKATDAGWSPPDADFQSTRSAAGSHEATPEDISGGLAGFGETALHAGTGFLGSLGGGLTYLSTLALTRGDTDAAKAVQEATQDALTYQPRTELGQEIVGGIGKAAQATIGRATDFLSDRAAELHGPAAGAFERTVLEGAPYVLGLGPTKRLAEGSVSRLGPAIDSIGKEPPPPEASPSTQASAGAPPATATPELSVAAGSPRAYPEAHLIGASAATPPEFEPAPPLATGPVDEPAAGPLSPEEQAQREATLKTIGLTEARHSAITGDRKAAATDYQVSNLDTEGGNAAAESFSKEREALSSYLDQLVADSGGFPGLDETSLHNRGDVILHPFEALAEHYDDRISELYKQADAKAQGLPVELKSTEATLGNRPSFIGTTDGQALLRGINAYLRTANILDDTGALTGVTAKQAERFKQYLNEQWTPRTGRLIRALKDAIDDDVASSAGEDVYAQARAYRRARANLLDDPKGLASLLDSSGPGGINRAVSLERVPDTLLRMPVDQFNHVIDTLQGVAPELKVPAQVALSGIRAQLLLRLQEQAEKLKGSWNNRGVTQYLNGYRAKLAKVFSPAELERLKALNSAGHILDVDRRYPGATVQGHNLAVRGAIAGIKHGTGAVGAHVAGPFGAVAGEMLGGKVAGALEGSASRKAWKKRVRKLSPG